MQFKKLRKSESQKIMESWNSQVCISQNLNDDYKKIREKLLTFWKEANYASKQSNTKEYSKDLTMGLKLYIFLNEELAFTTKNAMDDGIWRYLSIMVVPDIVVERYGLNEDRFWNKTMRIWLKSLWWYIHLSWQGSFEETFEVLRTNSTDEIMHLVDRTGKLGYRVELSRMIMKIYSEIPETIKKNPSSNNGYPLFRRIMKLHTAKSLVIEPELMSGGNLEYINMLLKELGVDYINETI